MKEKRLMLSGLQNGESARIKNIYLTGSIRRRLLDMSFNENAEIVRTGESPGGSSAVYLLRGALIALRREYSEKNRGRTLNRRAAA